jgi:hypothetical protein
VTLTEGGIRVAGRIAKKTGVDRINAPAGGATD